MKKHPLDTLKVKGRKAIAMVELIFAIVVIGIALLSVPNLIHQATESGFTTIQQESIAAAASDLSLILSREWDEADTNESLGAPILTTATITTSLNARDGGRSRVYNTGVGGTPLTASGIGPDGDFDDIDDADGITGSVTLIDGTQDLIDVNIAIATDIDYISDGSSNGPNNWNNSETITFNTTTTPPFATSGTTTNIKRVSITLTSNSGVDELQKTIILNALSANIGSYKLERRELP